MLADHLTDTQPTYKRDTTGDSVQSEAMIEALRALQSKIARLEMERASAAEKFESLSLRTSQKQLDLFDRPAVTENILEAPQIQPVSGRELRKISYTSVGQVIQIVNIYSVKPVITST